MYTHAYVQDRNVNTKTCTHKIYLQSSHVEISAHTDAYIRTYIHYTHNVTSRTHYKHCLCTHTHKLKAAHTHILTQPYTGYSRK